jgi:hypothetical protein
MKNVFIAAVLWSFVLGSCKGEPTLQKYFVANTENKNFVTFDISPDILNLDMAKLSVEQKEALQSFDKMNILAFKLDDKNGAEFVSERAKLTAILKNEKYQQLMKFGSGKEGASVSFIGDDDHIEEFVLFANKKENGFAVVRVLGNDMNPTNIMVLMQILQKSNIDLKQLKPLQEFLK